jgi:hypothetical protein
MAVVDGDLQVFERTKKLDRAVIVAQREFFHAPLRASPGGSVNRNFGLYEHIQPGPFLNATHQKYRLDSKGNLAE